MIRKVNAFKLSMFPTAVRPWSKIAERYFHWFYIGRDQDKWFDAVTGFTNLREITGCNEITDVGFGRHWKNASLVLVGLGMSVHTLLRAIDSYDLPSGFELIMRGASVMSILLIELSLETIKGWKDLNYIIIITDVYNILKSSYTLTKKNQEWLTSSYLLIYDKQPTTINQHWTTNN